MQFDVILGTTGDHNLRTKSLPNCILMQFAHRSKYIVTPDPMLGTIYTSFPDLQPKQAFHTFIMS